MWIPEPGQSPFPGTVNRFGGGEDTHHAKDSVGLVQREFLAATTPVLQSAGRNYGSIDRSSFQPQRLQALDYRRC